MIHLRVWLTISLSLLVLAGCASPYDQNIHPRRVTVTSELSQFHPVDLDGDGRDELVRRGQTPGGAAQSVLIRSLSGRAVAQVQFDGSVLNIEYQDLNQNGRLELIVSVRRGDSLFYDILSEKGRRLHQFAVVGGRARSRSTESRRWDVRGAHLQGADVTGNGKNELISFFKTGFARQPRGIWVHSYPEGKTLGHLRMGVLADGDYYFGDADADGHAEWFFGSKATNNGATGAGMTDARAYVGAIEVTSSPRVEWVREMGDTFSAAEVRHGDIDGDGRVEILALRKPREGRQTPSPLLHLDVRTGNVQNQYVPTSIIRQMEVGTLDGDGSAEIVALHESGTVRILDGSFRVIHQRRFDAPVDRIQLLSDLDADGKEELVVQTQKGALWLSDDLSTVAGTPVRGHWRVVQTGIGQSPQIAAVPSEPSGKMSLLRVEGNPWWWLVRYGPLGGVVLGCVLLLGGSVWAVRRYHSGRVRDALHEQVVSRSNSEWLLLHPDEGIEGASAGAARMLDLNGRDVTRRALREAVPALLDVLDDLAAPPVIRKDRSVSVNGRDLSLTFTSLDVSRRGRPYGLVWIAPESPSAEEYRARGLMAQQVAHDLKNPLTSILLTLQRMQMAYREANGELADTLDGYTERIEDRIASLRRMTTNVLKFVGKEDLRRTRTSVNDFLADLCDALEKNLPPDIDFERRFDTPLPSIGVDHDQFRSVIENLVGNAVEAMPEGGRLTVSTRLARDLCLNGDPARDYVVVEVQDTGVGMTVSERERIFEPGFSTRDDTGLGMALVRRVIDHHDGDIEIESEPDIGTSVTLYLPAENVDGDS